MARSAASLLYDDGSGAEGAWFAKQGRVRCNPRFIVLAPQSCELFVFDSPLAEKPRYSVSLVHRPSLLDANDGAERPEGDDSADQGIQDVSSRHAALVQQVEVARVVPCDGRVRQGRFGISVALPFASTAAHTRIQLFTHCEHQRDAWLAFLYRAIQGAVVSRAEEQERQEREAPPAEDVSNVDAQPLPAARAPESGGEGQTGDGSDPDGSGDESDSSDGPVMLRGWDRTPRRAPAPAPEPAPVGEESGADEGLREDENLAEEAARARETVEAMQVVPAERPATPPQVASFDPAPWLDSLGLDADAEALCEAFGLTGRAAGGAPAVHRLCALSSSHMTRAGVTRGRDRAAVQEATEALRTLSDWHARCVRAWEAGAPVPAGLLLRTGNARLVPREARHRLAAGASAMAAGGDARARSGSLPAQGSGGGALPSTHGGSSAPDVAKAAVEEEEGGAGEEEEEEEVDEEAQAQEVEAQRLMTRLHAVLAAADAAEACVPEEEQVLARDLEAQRRQRERERVEAGKWARARARAVRETERVSRQLQGAATAAKGAGGEAGAAGYWPKEAPPPPAEDVTDLEVSAADVSHAQYDAVLAALSQEGPEPLAQLARDALQEFFAITAHLGLGTAVPDSGAAFALTSGGAGSATAAAAAAAVAKKKQAGSGAAGSGAAGVPDSPSSGVHVPASLALPAVVGDLRTILALLHASARVHAHAAGRTLLQEARRQRLHDVRARRQQWLRQQRETRERLRRELGQLRQRSKASDGSADARGGAGAALALAPRGGGDQASTAAAVGQSGGSGDPADNLLAGQDMLARCGASGVAEQAVHSRVFPDVWPALWRLFSTAHEEEDARALRAAQALEAAGLEEFGVSQPLCTDAHLRQLRTQAPDAYARLLALHPDVEAAPYTLATDLVARAGDERTPADVARCLTAATEALTREVDAFWDAVRELQEQHGEWGPLPLAPPAADCVIDAHDLLGLLQYCLSRAQVPGVCALVSLVVEFLPEELASSDVGYHVTIARVAAQALPRLAEEVGGLPQGAHAPAPATPVSTASSGAAPG